jgi:hypothetical protein
MQVPLAGAMPALSCPATTLCVAGSYSATMITSTNPTGDASAWTATQLGLAGVFHTISCPTTSFCVAGDDQGEILTLANPAGGPSAWSHTLIDGPSACNSSPCLIERLYAYDTQGTQVLDTSLGGTGNTITNIQLSNDQLTWTTNGVSHQATLQ